MILLLLKQKGFRVCWMQSTLQQTSAKWHPTVQNLRKLLRKFEPLFDGTLGHWKTDPVDLFLKDPDCTPYHAKPYPVPYSQERKLKDEIERICTAGVM
jgi:hypothetical protein